jgi:hypothetical protein
MENIQGQIPKGLRVWFVIHFVVDMLFAIPLLFLPELIMPLLGWKIVDPITSRLVGAALLGIGIESLLGRDANQETFKAMLNLKIIWASGAIFALGLGLYKGGPPIAGIFLGIFFIFWGVWIYYRYQLGNSS